MESYHHRPLTTKSGASVDEIRLRNPQPYLDDHALEHFDGLKINGQIIFSKVPFTDVGTHTETLIRAGFWPVTIRPDCADAWQISAMKPAEPVPTFLELGHHGLEKASVIAEERFLSHALQDVQSDATRLPELRDVLSKFPNLHVRFEAELFQMRRQVSTMETEREACC